MKIVGKWIFLDNHSMENINKMYQWAMDKELIEIELGKLNNENMDINYFKDNIMIPYIENNHEANTPFCHFGIYRKYNKEQIGYVDFQNINENSAELSLSIPDKYYRNKHYGIDTVLTSLKYGLEVRKIKNIIIKTRIDNNIVKNICEKLGIEYTIEHFSENNYDIKIIKYQINKEVYIEIENKIIRRNK
jgi:RimJ/RimL family protein N-acetyltransferase